MIAFAFLLAHCLLMVGQYVIDGKRIDIFNPKNLFQLYFIIQLPCVLFIGVNFYVPGFVALSPTTSTDEITNLGLIFLLAHVSFLFAYYSAGKVTIRLPFIVGTRWAYLRTKVLCFLIFCFGYTMLFYLFEINGGYEDFVANREGWRAGGMVGQGWILFPATAMLAMATSAVLIASRKTFAQRNGVLKLLGLCVIAIFPASQLGFRGLILLPLLQILFVYNYKINKLDVARSVPIFCVLVVLFTLYGIYRESYHLMGDGFNLDIVLQFISDRPDFLFSIFLRSKGADVFAAFLRQIDESREFVYFIPALFESLTIVIPSALWADKPVPQGVIFSQNFFGIGGGVSPTVVGEAYWQAGIVGVIIVMMMLGLIFRIYVNFVHRYSNDDASIFICGVLFPSLVMMAEAVQGYLNGIILMLIVGFIMVFLFSVGSNKRSDHTGFVSPR